MVSTIDDNIWQHKKTLSWKRFEYISGKNTMADLKHIYFIHVLQVSI